jgi:conjugative transposon TraK protein
MSIDNEAIHEEDNIPSGSEDYISGTLIQGESVTPRKVSDDIVSSFKRNSAIAIASILSSAVVIAIISVSSIRQRGFEKNGVFILDEGAAFHGSYADSRSVDISLEIEDHVGRFHEHLFNLSPTKGAIEESLEAAYRLSDRSVYEYTMDLSEKGYYSRMISANISQQIVVDSVIVSLGEKPYPVKTYSRLYIVRESSVSEYSLISSCEIIPVHRSSDNPHGLMIEKFRVLSEELSSSAKR